MKQFSYIFSAVDVEALLVYSIKKNKNLDVKNDLVLGLHNLGLFLKDFLKMTLIMTSFFKKIALAGGWLWKVITRLLNQLHPSPCHSMGQTFLLLSLVEFRNKEGQWKCFMEFILRLACIFFYFFLFETQTPFKIHCKFASSMTWGKLRSPSIVIDYTKLQWKGDLQLVKITKSYRWAIAP